MYGVNTELHFMLFLKGRLCGLVGCTQSLESEEFRFIFSIQYFLLVQFLANCFPSLHINFFFLLSDLTGLLCQLILVLKRQPNFFSKIFTLRDNPKA